MSERYAFPGLPPFVDEVVADESRHALKDKVRNVGPLVSIASFLAQACDAPPENREAILANIDGQREILAVALEVADAAVAKVRSEIGVKPRKKAKADEVPQGEPTPTETEATEEESEGAAEPEVLLAPEAEAAPSDEASKPRRGRPKSTAPKAPKGTKGKAK